MVHDSLDSALEGCPLALGTSARLRSLPMPMFDARRAARQALQESGAHDVAIYLNDGTGNFSGPTTYQVGIQTSPSEAADFDHEHAVRDHRTRAFKQLPPVRAATVYVLKSRRYLHGGRQAPAAEGSQADRRVR